MSIISKIRPNGIDYAKVFMIYLVVLGHYTYALDMEFEPSGVWNLMHIITLFHMPFFFIVSGVLFKPISVRETVNKGWIQLLRPYIIMCTVSCFVMILIDFFAHQFSPQNSICLAIGILTGNDGPYSMANWSSALWFCYALFLIKIIMSFYLSISNKILRMIGGGILVILTILCLYSGDILPFRIDSAIIGLFFFFIGFTLKLFQKIEMSSKVKILFAIVLIGLLIISAYYNLDLHQRQSLSINAAYYGNYPWLFIISGICGSILVLLMTSFIEVHSPTIKKIVLTISNGTIVILGFHWMIYKVFFSWWLVSEDIIVSLVVSLLVLIICYFLIVLASKYCPAVLGNRNIK